MAVQFGVATAPGSYGKIQNFTANGTAQIATYADENGDTAGYQEYDEQEEVSFQYVFDGTAPTPGTTITFTYDGGSKKYVVESVSLVESNTDFRRMDVTARRWTTNTIPS